MSSTRTKRRAPAGMTYLRELLEAQSKGQAALHAIVQEQGRTQDVRHTEYVKDRIRADLQIEQLTKGHAQIEQRVVAAEAQALAAARQATTATAASDALAGKVKEIGEAVTSLVTETELQSVDLKDLVRARQDAKAVEAAAKIAAEKADRKRTAILAMVTVAIALITALGAAFAWFAAHYEPHPAPAPTSVSAEHKQSVP